MSVFAGRGLLGTWQSTDTLVELAAYFDWIAPLARLPETTPAQLAAIKAAGARPLIWEDENSNEGWRAIERLAWTDAAGVKHHAEGYGGQAEGQAQHDEKVSLGAELDARGVEKALISSVSFLPEPDHDHPVTWPAGWGAIPEAYLDENPNASPANMEFETVKRGGKVVSMLFGLYHGGAPDVSLAGYLALWPDSKPWSGYSASSVSQRPDDLATIRALPPKHGGSTPTPPPPPPPPALPSGPETRRRMLELGSGQEAAWKAGGMSETKILAQRIGLADRVLSLSDADFKARRVAIKKAILGK